MSILSNPVLGGLPVSHGVSSLREGKCVSTVLSVVPRRVSFTGTVPVYTQRRPGVSWTYSLQSFQTTTSSTYTTFGSDGRPYSGSSIDGTDRPGVSGRRVREGNMRESRPNVDETQ